MGRKTSIEDKAKALATYIVSGGNLNQAAAAGGVSPDAVTKWVVQQQDDIERVRQELQKEYIPKLMDLGNDLLKKATDSLGKVEVKTARDMQSIVISYGIVVDKMRVILGLPDRIEHLGSIEHNISGLEERERNIEERRAALRAQYGEIIDVECRPVPPERA